MAIYNNNAAMSLSAATILILGSYFYYVTYLGKGEKAGEQGAGSKGKNC
jgi:hypothetical protein